MNQFRQLVWLIFLAGSLFLLAACGPSVQTAENETGAGESVEAPTRRAEAALPFEPENDDQAVAPTDATEEEAAAVTTGGLEVDGDRSGVDETGTKVGFTADGHAYRGNPDAPVVIEAFSDYQCPYCSRFVQQTLPGLAEEYLATGEAVLVYYEFPLESIHPQARAAAKAALCAGDQAAAAYWHMHDMLFNNTQEWAGQAPDAIFAGYAADLNLDVEAFQSCQASDEHDATIDADLAEGGRRGVRGTPAFFINGQLMAGAQPLTVFQQAIAQAGAGEPIAVAEGSVPPAAVSPDDVELPPPADLSTEVAASLGDPDAPVTLVEFTDYQCPFCARHSLQTFPQLRAEYIDTGKVRYVLKDLPLDQIHPKARLGAVAARCAGEQNGYWAMHDALYAEQERWTTAADSNATLAEMAVELGLEKSDFAACLESGRYDEAIQANADEAASLGADGTPFFFVDGYPVISGAQPFEQFAFILDLALNDGLEDAIREAIAAAQSARQQQAQPPPQGPTGPVDVPVGDAPFIGDPDAPVTLVEYTDYQCPFCARHFNETYSQILENYVETGQVRYVFKDFPLTNIHPQAVLAAEAARCAHEQEAFQAIHDALFIGQQEWANNEGAGEIFISYAGELGLDVDSFQSCLVSHKYQEAVMADLAEGSGFGVNGTPGFFVNGLFINGAQPYSVFESAIEQALAEAEQ